jgi:Ca2+-transporting ATPase
MAARAASAGSPSLDGGELWYALSGEEVAARLDVDPAVGLSAAHAAKLLEAHGPNALPAEPPVPGWRRFAEQYRTYMQMILVGAAIVSLTVQEWSTTVMLVVITVLNAVVGLRQEGKAESAMNALKAMVEATARVRRDGVERELAVEEVVPGDVVLLAAGDETPADGRIVEASALQIDESALTGESTPAAKQAMPPEGQYSGGRDSSEGRDSSRGHDSSEGPDSPRTNDSPGRRELAPGDQTDMAFMHTPVTHGSATMIVTATGSDTQVGKIAGMLSATAREQTPLTRQLNTLTLWIAAAAGFTMVTLFILGAQRGESRSALFVSAVALAIASIPEAMPTVLQVVLSLGAADLAQRGAIVKDLGSVETLGSTSAINSDKTGTLTLNQMTAVEVVDPTDRYSVSGSGYELDGRVHHAAGSSDTIEAAILPYLVASDAELVDGKVVGDPTEGRCSCSPTRRASTSPPRASATRAWRRCRSTPPTS